MKEENKDLLYQLIGVVFTLMLGLGVVAWLIWLASN